RAPAGAPLDVIAPAPLAGWRQRAGPALVGLPRSSHLGARRRLHPYRAHAGDELLGMLIAAEALAEALRGIRLARGPMPAVGAMSARLDRSRPHRLPSLSRL